MSKKEEIFFNKQGLKMLHGGQLAEAVEFFTRAIELNPEYAEAYMNRGEVLKLLGREVEGNLDIRTAKDLKSGKFTSKEPRQKVTKLNMAEIESIYDSVYPEGATDDETDTIEFDSDLFDYVFSDDSIETERVWNGLTQGQKEAEDFPAILEYVGGQREEALRIRLFHPLANDVSVIGEDGNIQKVVPLDQLCCIRMAGVPDDFRLDPDSSCHVEIIETNDGNIFHEAMIPEQQYDQGLFGFSTKEQTRFKYTFFPKVNIRKRCQQRYLGEILLEKRFIAGEVLKKSLEEFEQMKEMKFGKIIAQMAQLQYSAIEEEIQRAHAGPLKGLKIGEILLAAGLVNESQVLEALEYQESLRSKKIGQFLVEKGILHESEVYISLAEKFRIPFIDLRKIKVNKKILSLLDPDFVVRQKVLPVTLKDAALVVATMLPDPSPLCEDILKYSKIPNVQFVLAQPSHLKNVINVLYKTKGYLAQRSHD